MHLKNIGARNFLGYKKLDLEVEPGLWLIDGVNHHYATNRSNGSGKSSLQEVIAYATFGKTLRPLKVEEVIRENPPGNQCAVWCDYVQPGGEMFRIERYRNHRRYHNQVRVLLDGKDDIEGRYKRSSADNITKRLGFDYDLFTRAIVLHSRMTESFVSVQDRYLKQITEKLVGMPDFKPLLERTKDASKDISLDVERIEEHIQYLKDALVDKRGSLKSYRKALAEQKTEESTKQIRDIQNLIRVTKKQKSKHYQNMTDVFAKIAKAEKQLSKAKMAVFKATQEKERYYQREIIVKRARMELIAKQKGKYRNLGSKPICPECEQEVSAEHIKKKMLELDKEYSVLVTQVALADVTDSRNKKAETEAFSKEAMIRENLDTLREQHAKHHEYFKLCKRDIHHNEKALALHLRQVEKQASPYKKLIKDVIKEITLTKWKLADQRVALAKRKKRYLYYEYWKHGFGPHGIRSYILDAVMPVLNHNANIYLDVLTDGQMTVRMAPTKEKKDGSLSDGFTFEVDNLSGSSKLAGDCDGELASVDLAVNFAMSDVLESRINGGCGFMVVDQAVDLFDTVGGKKAIQLLYHKLNADWCKKQGVPSKRTIWLITHREALKGLIANRIEVEKRNGICRIVSTGW